MKLARVLLLHAVFLFCFVLPSYGALDVYLKDGTVRHVTKLEFWWKEARLYLENGSKEVVNVSDIDFKSTGLEDPGLVQGLTFYSISKGNKDNTSDANSQEALAKQWQDAEESAVALKKLGSIKAGDRVRILALESMVITLISKDSQGVFHRHRLDSGTFEQTFQREDIRQPGPIQHASPPPEKDGTLVIPEKSQPQAQDESAEKLSQPEKMEERSTTPVAVILLGIVSAGVGVFLLIKGRGWVMKIVGFAVIGVVLCVIVYVDFWEDNKDRFSSKLHQTFVELCSNDAECKNDLDANFDRCFQEKMGTFWILSPTSTAHELCDCINRASSQPHFQCRRR